MVTGVGAVFESSVGRCVLRTDVALKIEKSGVAATFTLEEGQSVDIELEWNGEVRPLAAGETEQLFARTVKDWVCAECGGTGALLIMDDRGPLCMTCADLDHLVFRGPGDAALTRRAKKASVLSAVVVSHIRRPRSELLRFSPVRRSTGCQRFGLAACTGSARSARCC